MPGWLTNGDTLASPANYNATNQGSSQLPVDTNAPTGISPQSMAYPITAFGGPGAWTTVTAAGATQGNATALSNFKNLITVSTTASTHGVKLPTAVTGLSIMIGNTGTFGVKVYPPTGGQVAAASTNAADTTVLAINKVNVYHAVNATKWIVFRGA